MPFRSEPIALAVALAMGAAVPAAGQTEEGRAGCALDAKPADLNFTVKDLNGNDVTPAPCKVELPGFIELSSKYRAQGLQISARSWACRRRS